MEISQGSTSQSKKNKDMDNYIRELIIQARFNEGMTHQAIADKYKVPKSTVKNILKHWIQTETIEVINYGGSRYHKLTDADDQLLREWLEENPQLILEELQKKLQEEHSDGFD